MGMNTYQIELPLFENLGASGIYDDDGCKRLILALCAQALRDAKSRAKGKNQNRYDARHWLLNYGAPMFEILGYRRINQNVIETWVEGGCQLPKNEVLS